MTDQKLFIITRSDLAPGVQCAQACHAIRAFVAAHSEREADWYRDSNNLVVLSVTDEASLASLCEMLEQSGSPCARFHEPDFGDQLTAIAALPTNPAALRKLPLALRAA